MKMVALILTLMHPSPEGLVATSGIKFYDNMETCLAVGYYFAEGIKKAPTNKGEELVSVECKYLNVSDSQKSTSLYLHP